MMQTPAPTHSEGRSGQSFRKKLFKRIDNRIGNSLFIGAALPELAAELVSRGIPVMLVESDTRLLEGFLQRCRELGVDKKVSVDPRPYPDIAFEASSYNVVLAWKGIPAGMPPAAFFKKVRRELKAGSRLFLRTRVRPARPEFVARVLPASIAQRLDGAEKALLATPLGRLLDAPSLEELKRAGAGMLKFEKVEVSGPVSRLAETLTGLASTPLPEAIEGLLSRTDETLGQRLMPVDVLIEASKTLDMGKVFLTGSRFDPERGDLSH